MNSERFKKAEKIYHAALELDPDRRPHFLEEECGGDFELKREIESLLSFDNNPASFIDGSPDDLAAKLLAKKREIPGSLVNKKIGRYRVEKILGIGGMGTVYLATDTRLARPVALKVLASEIVRDRDRVQRFMHEARAASALNHPHILTVYEFDEFTDEEDETLHFISMEFVEGKTLDNLIYSDKTSTTELFKYLAQAAKGLAKAHAAGIIHRDLKPENIMVSNDGYAKILDFGLAKLTDTEHELHILQQHKSRSGVILGTLGYMSPEQAQGKRDIDERSDIFALGCVLYEAVAKRKAFEADSAIDSLHKIIHAEPAPLKEIYPNVPAELEELVAKCLEKDPTDRYRNASHIARLLEKISTETIDQSKPFISSNEAKTIIREKKITRESPARSFSGQRRQVT
ncbi:MAG: serine/threonine protein kinase, partial [Acidobacteriota bacterium]|nr:serine/threonine protein kinase [Acidobacteriota bacterium]